MKKIGHNGCGDDSWDHSDETDDTRGSVDGGTDLRIKTVLLITATMLWTCDKETIRSRRQPWNKDSGVLPYIGKFSREKILCVKFSLRLFFVVNDNHEIFLTTKLTHYSLLNKFRLFINRGWWQPRKLVNSQNFPIYGIQVSFGRFAWSTLSRVHTWSHAYGLRTIRLQGFYPSIRKANFSTGLPPAYPMFAACPVFRSSSRAACRVFRSSSLSLPSVLADAMGTPTHGTLLAAINGFLPGMVQNLTSSRIGWSSSDWLRVRLNGVRGIPMNDLASLELFIGSSSQPRVMRYM